MDCVGCERCKLWGKLQTLGIATALKVLFHDAECGVDAAMGAALAATAAAAAPAAAPQAPLILERNEIIALVNLLARLSSSLETVRALAGPAAASAGLPRPSLDPSAPLL